MARAEIDWEDRAAYHEREIQAIKKRLKAQHGGVFDVYSGIGSMRSNNLRRALENHRTSLACAKERRLPTREELDEDYQKVVARGEL